MAKRHQVGIDIKTSGDTSGARKVEGALDDIEMSAKEVRDMMAQTKGLDPKVQKQLSGVAGQLERVNTTGRKATQAQTGLGKSTRRTDLAMLSFSQAVEDAQYGVRGILNNIPSLVMQLGGGAGLAGVISLSAVGLSTLYTQLTKTDEKVEETAEEVDVLKEYFKDLNEEVENARFEAYADKLQVVDNMIKRQNESLRANIKFTQQKAKEELAVAAAQDDIARAQIAQRVQYDPNFTEQDAAEARNRLDAGRIARETEASIAEEQAKIEAATIKYKETAEQRQAVQERTQELERKYLEMEQELFQLQSKKTKQRLLAKERESGLALDNSISKKVLNATRILGGPAANVAIDKREVDVVSQAAVDFEFTAEEGARLEKVEERLSELKEMIASGNEDFKDLTTKTFEIGQELDNTERAAESAKENAQKLGELKGALLEIKAETAATAAARDALATGAQDLRDEAERVADSNAVEASAFKETATQLDKILQDGVVSVTELKSIQTTLGHQSQALAGAQSQGAALTRDLQGSVLEIKRKMAAMEQVQAQINSRTP